MQDFFINHWSDILLTLITTGAITFCSFIYKKYKNLKSFIKKQQSEELDNVIDKKIEPIVEEIEKLRQYVLEIEIKDKAKMDLIIDSYKYRLVQLCKIYLNQGFMTQDQYDQLTEMFKLYTALGGNGQAKDYYEKTEKLQIKSAQ